MVALARQTINEFVLKIYRNSFIDWNVFRSEKEIS